MPEIIETPVYRIGDLDASAREAARAWYRDGGFDYEWYDGVYTDFEQIAEILGITLKTRPVRLMGGGTRNAPCIFFSGFWSQGDGASFEAIWTYAKGAAKALRAYAPQDTALHAIADLMQDVQRRNFYQLVADVSQSGRYAHEHTMQVRLERDSASYQDMTEDAEDIVIEVVRDLARWLYAQLERTYEDITSDEAVDEVLEMNEYTFTADGERFG